MASPKVPDEMPRFKRVEHHGAVYSYSDASQICKGDTHLPTVNELAKIAFYQGALPIVTDRAKLTNAIGYHPILWGDTALNARVAFYYNPTGYRPKRMFVNRCFWSSSSFPDNQSRYYLSPQGDLTNENAESTYCSVICIKNSIGK
jgi:hypothetical protein